MPAYRANQRLRAIVIAATLISASACDPEDEPATTEAPGSSDTVGTTAPEVPVEVEGFADLHTHMFDYLAFGGRLFSHSVNPTEPCRATLPFPDNTYLQLAPFPIAEAPVAEDVIRFGLLAQDSTQGAGCWPTNTNQVAQQMDTTSLKRAVDGGLRLIVMLAVNNEYLCEQGHLSDGRSDQVRRAQCDDATSIVTQLNAAWSLQDRLDTEAGGPGRGWFRVVTTPEQAREAISAGKLAVVLGVETDNPYDCDLPAEACADPLVRRQVALVRFQQYYGLGARHFFLVHDIDTGIAGVAHAVELVHSQTPIDNADADRVITGFRPPVSPTIDCRWAGVGFDGGRCNSVGLLDPGRSLLRQMIDAGVVIDIDHMGLRTRRDSLRVLGGYPAVAGHTSLREQLRGDAADEWALSPDDIAYIRDNGGVIGLMLNPVDDHDQFDPQINCAGSSDALAAEYRYLLDNGFGEFGPTGGRSVGVAFGSDFNGFTKWLHGRVQTPPDVAAREAKFDELVRLSPLGLAGLEPEAVWEVVNVYSPEDSCSPRIEPPIGNASPECHRDDGPPPPECSTTTTIPRKVHTGETIGYPFTSPFTGQEFNRMELPWSGHDAYDFNTDGMANVGMYPDLIEDLIVNGLTVDELQPLYRGAEAYVQAWEWSLATSERRRSEPSECTNLRSSLFTQASVAGHTTPELQQTARRIVETHCEGSATDQARVHGTQTTLSVTAIDSSGNAVPGAAVSVDGQALGATDERGLFASTEVRLAVGEHTVEVDAGTYFATAHFTVSRPTDPEPPPTTRPCRRRPCQLIP